MHSAFVIHKLEASVEVSLFKNLDSSSAPQTVMEYYRHLNQLTN